MFYGEEEIFLVLRISMQCPLILLVHVGWKEGKVSFKVSTTVYYGIDKGSSYISDEEWILLCIMVLTRETAISQMKNGYVYI